MWLPEQESRTSENYIKLKANRTHRRNVYDRHRDVGYDIKNGLH